MIPWRRFRSWLGATLGRSHVENEMDAELRFHVEAYVEDLVRSGLPRQEAMRRARLEFGGIEQTKEQCRDEWHVNLLDSTLQDLRFAFRTLRKRPAFTFLAVLTLAFGIGINTSLFTIVHSVLFSPLPFPEPDRLVSLWERSVIDENPYNEVSGGIFEDWQHQSASFSQMALIGEDSANLSGDGGALPEAIGTRFCSYNLFSMLGVQPIYGRSFSADDDRAGATPTVILTYGIWKRRYAADPAMIGKTIRLNAMPYTVVGILPAWFDYPDRRVQAWLPANHEVSTQDMHNRGNHRFFVTARLKSGITVAQARTELDGVQQRIHQQFPDALIGKGANVVSLSENLVRDVKTSLFVLMAAVSCVLLIACLNVASLFVAHSATRRKEFALRTALGGTRWRLIRGQLTESMLLTFSGGGVGALLAFWSIRWLVALRGELPRANSIHVDQNGLLFTIAVTLASGIIAGLLPSLSATRGELLEPLKDGSRFISGGQHRAQLRKLLLTVEVALTVVLLIGAGLMLKSFEELRSVRMGCATDNVLTMSFTLPDAKYEKPFQKAQFFEELLARVRSTPAVNSAGVVTVLPGNGHFFDNTFTVEGRRPLLPGQFQDVVIRGSDPAYFTTMNIPLLRGRYFTDADRSQNGNAAVITSSIAHKFFPDEDPLGKVLVIDWDRNPRFQIVGIVGDVLSNLDAPPEPTAYLPLNSGRFEYGSLVVRSALDATSLALPIQKEIARMDPDLPVADILTMEQIIGKSTASAMFDASLVLFFALLALILAAVGLYGLLSYLVTQRNKEIGIRIALGAQRRAVLQFMLLEGLRPILIGLLIGLIGGTISGHLIRSALFGVQPLDLTTFLAVALLVLAVAVAASLVPAWRASRSDPMAALRCE
jgi:predicted permease